MATIELGVTPTGFKVLLAMLRFREHGVENTNRYVLAVCVKACPSTVRCALRGFIEQRWVTASRSVDPETGVNNPTVYRLTDEAPSLDQLLGIELGV